MTVIYLDELTSEQALLDVLPDLENEVIEAVCATRNKARLVTAAQTQVKQVIKKCAARRWMQAKKQLNIMFKSLESAAAEVEQNLWVL
jgi:hypothetical protein|tara:strand:+ start:87 stop:350 length:264 start_codon:yes stop_codon:yes gene_type:complete